MSAHAVSIRIQRIKTESTHVKVWITDDYLIDHPDGTQRLNPDKLIQDACELAQVTDAQWTLENEEIRPHPTQTPPHQF
jgi:hypothetical protein